MLGVDLLVGISDGTGAVDICCRCDTMALWFSCEGDLPQPGILFPVGTISNLFGQGCCVQTMYFKFRQCRSLILSMSNIWNVSAQIAVGSVATGGDGCLGVLCPDFDCVHVTAPCVGTLVLRDIYQVIKTSMLLN